MRQSPTARVVDFTTPGLEEKFRLPRGISDQALLTLARTFGNDAFPLKAKFIKRGLHADFIAELDEAARAAWESASRVEKPIRRGRNKSDGSSPSDPAQRADARRGALRGEQSGATATESHSFERRCNRATLPISSLTMKNLLSRKSLALLAVVAVAYLVNTLLGILSNIVSEDAKEFLERAGVSHYRVPLAVGLAIAGLFIAVWGFIAQKDERWDGTAADDVPESERASRAFLDDLDERYRERNACKLDGRYQIPLAASDDLEGARRLDDEFGADAPGRDAAQYVIERFARDGRLMIIGSPGSGKTMLLLALARHLVEEARKDSDAPLPVIFNLESWSPRYARFEDWARETLTRGYGLSPDFAGDLLATGRIVFLLDGLDELARNEEPGVAAALRAECLASLLDRALHDGTMSAVVCCRREQLREMLQQTGGKPPLPLVSVHDLTAGQIDRALIKAGRIPRDGDRIPKNRDRFAAPNLLAALGNDRGRAFQQVISTPFYFTTALQVFDSTRPPHIEAPDKQTLEVNLLKAFVEKKLQVTPNERGFSADKTLAWLKWLAVLLQSRKRDLFELSDLQPSALKRPWLYRLLFCLAFGLTGGLIMSRFRIIPDSMFATLIFVFVGGYIINEGLARWTFEPLRRWRTWRGIFWASVAVGILFGIVLVYLLLQRLEKPELTWGGAVFLLKYMPLITLAAILAAVPFWALVLPIARLFAGTAGGRAVSDIVTEDFAHWSFEPLRHQRTWLDILIKGLAGSINGATVGGGTTFIAGFILIIEGKVPLPLWLSFFSLPFVAFAGGLVGAPVGVVISTLLAFFRACRQTTRFAKIASPYQRLRAGVTFHVVELLVIAGGITALALLVTLLVGLVGGTDAFPFASGVAETILPFGLLGLFRTPLFKHTVLRLCLTLEGAMPLRYAVFLSYATELRILEKDGGQWRFRHQILQDYFARGAFQANEPSSREASEPAPSATTLTPTSNA